MSEERDNDNELESDTDRTNASIDDNCDEIYIEQIKPILKRKSLDECEVKTLPSILKKRDSFEWSRCETQSQFHSLSHPILKRHSLGSESTSITSAPQSHSQFIQLTHNSNTNPNACQSSSSPSCSSFASSSLPSSTTSAPFKPYAHSVHPILKHRSLDEKSAYVRDEHSLPKPILKKKWSIEDQIEKCCVIDTNGTSNKTKSILKPAFDDKTQVMSKTEVRGILKVAQNNNSLPFKSALKKSDQSSNDSKSESMKSILKPESVVMSDANSSQSDSSSETDETDVEYDSNTSDSQLSGDEEHASNNGCFTKINSQLSPAESRQSIDDCSQSSGGTKASRNDNKRTSFERYYKQKIDNKNYESSNLRDKETTMPSISISRSATQPIFGSNQQKTGLNSAQLSNGSISERLAALKRNGEESWKTRITYQKSDDDSQIMLRSHHSINSNKNRNSSIKDRVSLLEDASNQWKNRVEEKDVTQFTVAGKMKQTGTPVIITPEAKRITPKTVPYRFQHKLATNLSNFDQNKMSSSSPKPSTTNADYDNNNANSVKIKVTDCDKNVNPKETVTISLPKLDDETFTSFFPSLVSSEKSHDTSSSDNAFMSDDENIFDDISTKNLQLLGQKKSVRAQNRRFTSTNPIKKLANRNEFVVDSYVEVNANPTNQQKLKETTKPKKVLTELITPRKSCELRKSSSFAASALAGLASREDYLAVAGKLRSSTVIRDVWKSYELPNSLQTLMLIQVKGRRHAQTRLVEPDFKSINTGDCYLLVNRENIFAWIGELCNIIERNKTLDIANKIQKTKDLCFRSSNDIILVDNQNVNANNTVNNELFYKLLNKKDDDIIKVADNPEEDEYYEKAIAGTNMVYSVSNEELIAYEDGWARIPKYEMLTEEAMFVFDFGSEMYFWVGKLVTNQNRKIVYDLAKKLWNQGYNYTECDINPFGASVSAVGDKRPVWAWITKATQDMEPILFREKFANWPSDNNSIENARKRHTILM